MNESPHGSGRGGISELIYIYLENEASEEKPPFIRENLELD